MSASDKKKLRREQEAAKMTERQLAEQKEAKKLKLFTTLFIVVLAVIVAIAAIFAGSQLISTSGMREKNTAAVTIGENELSNAQLNYYFIDAVNQFYNQYGSYASMFGMDTTKPLNEQVTNEETGTTWADDFMTTALSNAKAMYALADEAKANGFTLSEEEAASVETNLENLESYAMAYGYGDVKTYLRAVYGFGADEESYREYTEISALATAYYNAYAETLTYDDAALRAADDADPIHYSRYNYNAYYLNINHFLEGGTTDENGTTTYSDAEKAAAAKKAEEVANTLIGEEIVTVDDLDAAVSALEINADAETPVTSTAYTDVEHEAIATAISAWVTDPARKTGDKAVLVNEGTTTGEDGTETTTISGYYVVIFDHVEDNNFALANVRHILVSFEGGTYDPNTGATTYSEAEKLMAQVAAEDLLNQWKEGKADELSFAALATEKSTDGGSKENGGLYEDVSPGQMVTTFNDWCFDESRKPGDTGVVETEYGYHVMYYVGDSETMYRDYLIENDLRSKDVEEWYSALIEAVTVTELNTEYISKDLVLSRG